MTIGFVGFARLAGYGRIYAGYVGYVGFAGFVLNNDLVCDLNSAKTTDFVPTEERNLDVGLSVDIEKKVEACKDAKSQWDERCFFK